MTRLSATAEGSTTDGWVLTAIAELTFDSHVAGDAGPIVVS